MNDLSLEGISKQRLMKYGGTLKIVAERLNKDFDVVEVSDLKNLISAIQQRVDYSPWTKQSYKIIIRRFYKWLYGTKDYPEIVSWININIHRSQKKLPSDEELLNEQDIQKLVQEADTLRDKAFVSVLWESGGRIGEIGGLCIKNVVFDQYGTVLTVAGKTGARKIRLIMSTPYVSNWINTHPLRQDKNAPLWIDLASRKNHNKAISYRAFWIILERLFQKAGIKKKCNPHIFRHARATYMASHLTEFQMNQYFGWIQGSDMPSTYVHMSGREVDDAILRMNGITINNKKEETTLQPRICSRCDTINTADSQHCSKCAGIVDIKYSVELEEKQRKMLENATRLGGNKLRDLAWSLDVLDLNKHSERQL